MKKCGGKKLFWTASTSLREGCENAHVQKYAPLFLPSRRLVAARSKQFLLNDKKSFRLEALFFIRRQCSLRWRLASARHKAFCPALPDTKKAARFERLLCCPTRGRTWRLQIQNLTCCQLHHRASIARQDRFLTESGCKDNKNTEKRNILTIFFHVNSPIHVKRILIQWIKTFYKKLKLSRILFPPFFTLIKYFLYKKTAWNPPISSSKDKISSIQSANRPAYFFFLLPLHALNLGFFYPFVP